MANTAEIIASQLPALEPMFGFSFALNLAYVGLPRFRYREQIRDFALKERGRVSEPAEGVTKLDWYQNVSRLIEIHNNNDNTSEPANLGEGSWAITYKRWFENHSDRKICIGFAIYNSIMVSLGSAHTAGFLKNVWTYNIEWLFFGYSTYFWFILTIFAMLVPVIFVKKGSGIVDKACNWAKREITGGLDTMTFAAMQAELPKTTE